MILNYYSVKDLMTNKFMNPMLMENDNIAMRQFKSNIEHINLWKDNPSDFDLFRLGTFNDETGELVPEVEKVCNGRSVYVPVKENN